MKHSRRWSAPVPPLGSPVPAVKTPGQEFAELLRLAGAMREAIARRDVRTAIGYMEAARGLGYAVLSQSGWVEVNRACLAIEADLQSELWVMALRSADYFIAAVRDGVRGTHENN